MRFALVLSLLGLHAEPLVLNVWPASPATNSEVTGKGADGEFRTRAVNTPTMTVHLPDPARANGTAVIICPGGGYMHLAIDKEGHDVAKFLNTHGVAGIVLKYRTMPPNITDEERKRLRAAMNAPLANATGFAKDVADDLREAIRLTQANASKWNVDPNRIGVMGFSAGAHLILTIALNPKEGLRPAFFVPVYGLVPEGSKFPAGTGPVFLVHAHDDPTVPVKAAIGMQAALAAANIPFEAHIFRDGGHGFGIRKKGIPVDQWPERLRDWLGVNGWLAGK